jgi:hypothetical protein
MLMQEVAPRFEMAIHSKSSSAKSRRRLIDGNCLPGLSIAEGEDPGKREIETRKSSFSRISSPNVPDFPTRDRSNAAAAL